MTRRIVACGGQQLYHPALTRYVLELTERSHPTILFLPTASGEDPAYLLTFYQQLAGVDCAPTHLALFHRTVADVERLIRAQDVVMVGGGNTANMLALWRLHGVEDALRKAYADGVILTGWSAGCICWCEAGITDSFTPDLGPLRDGVKLLKGIACPHYDSEERRRPVYAREIAAGLAPGVALEDAVAARHDDGRLVALVSARPRGRALPVRPGGAGP